MNWRFKLSRRLAMVKAAVLTAAALSACAADRSLLDPAAPSTPIDASVVASILVSPKADSIGQGGTSQLVAVVRDAQGSSLAGQVSWASTNNAVVNVTSNGLVTAGAAGTAMVVASVGSHADTSTIKVSAAGTPSTPNPAGPHAGYHVAPAGTSAGDGSAANPWDLPTALKNASGKIVAGDTVWMHGGTYRGNFLGEAHGTPGNPIVYRQYPGERATIDGTLRVNGADAAYWGFEIMSSAPSGRLPALEARGARQKYINLIIHDAAQQGITFWDEAVDAVVYGCLVYNNGTHENLDHGTYVHNMSGTKLIKDNVFFNNLAYGIHVYAGPGDGIQRNVHVIGNVSFDNGTISSNYAAKGNIIIGNEDGDEGMQAKDNLLYFAGSAGENLRVGYTASNRDVIVTGNTVYGGSAALVVGQWSNATVQNNTFGGPSQMVRMLAAPGAYTWTGNRYLADAFASAWGTSAGGLLTLSGWQTATGLGSGDQSALPTTTQVFVRKNDYEGGRAMVVVYNFGHQGSISADLSGAGLSIGQRYEVRNVQDMFGAPVASGTYNGGSITLPMTGVTPPARLGRTTATPPTTGPNFDTFIVVPV